LLRLAVTLVAVPTAPGALRAVDAAATGRAERPLELDVGEGAEQAVQADGM
jgi:hypothetical protein